MLSSVGIRGSEVAKVVSGAPPDHIPKVAYQGMHGTECGVQDTIL